MPRWVPRRPDPDAAAPGSGPAVARLFHALLAANLLVAWGSLGVQLRPLIGRRGLEPAAAWFDRLRAHPTAGFWDAPSLFWLDASDPVLLAGVGAGLLLAAAALVGLVPRALLALSAVLYLSVAHAAPTFLSFQWDNLLVEAGLLAALLPRDRRSPVAHFALRALLFKVFFESGLAKWSSAAGDWQDGSAMRHYYETAPLPTPLAHLAHHLPEWWHTLESWWAVGFELLVPILVFGGRWPRALALAVFGSFLVVDGATANYGFFVPLTAALCVFLLEERHAEALLRRAVPVEGELRPAARRATAALVATWVALSAQSGLARFAGWDPLPAVTAAARPLRVANTYHLFGSITTTRSEPEFQTSADGRTWRAHPLRFKPGPADRRPPLVAPHQPRLDFQLWFYGLRWRRSTPDYVARLLGGLCHDPARVQAFFPDRLPDDTVAVRIVFYDARFTTPEVRRESGNWWARSEEGATRSLTCAGDVPHPDAPAR